MITTCMYGDCSNWYKGYPDCGSDAQSPINLAANSHTVVKVRKTAYHKADNLRSLAPLYRLDPFRGVIVGPSTLVWGTNFLVVSRNY